MNLSIPLPSYLPNISITGYSKPIPSESQSGSNVSIQVEAKGYVLPEGCTMKVEYVDGKKEGVATVFSPKKTRIARLNYHEGKLNGLCLFYDDYGKIKKEAIYKNDVHTGWGCEYVNSDIVFSGFYENGNRASRLVESGTFPGYQDLYAVGNNILFCSCRLSKDHLFDGICYFYQNDITEVVEFENGEKKKLLQCVIKDSILFVFNDKEQPIYKGQFKRNNKNEYIPYGEGSRIEYKNDEVSSIHIMNNSCEKYQLEFDGDIMKEYEVFENDPNNKQLRYEGEFKGDIYAGYAREGRGRMVVTPVFYGIADFSNNVAVRRYHEVHGDIIWDYDEKNEIVYAGEFEGDIKKGYKRKGKGIIIDYDKNGKLSKVFDCYDNEKQQLRYAFESETTMTEYDMNGTPCYKGGYSGDCKVGYTRSGQGESYNADDSLEYTGNWENNQRNGKGMYYVDGILRYEGTWKDDLPVHGDYFDEDGKVLYSGYWIHGYYKLSKRRNTSSGILNGIWIDYHDGQKVGLNDDYKIIYKGEWNENNPDGKGVYYENGEKRFEGEWKDGRLFIENSLWFDFDKKCYVYIKNEKIAYEGGWKDGLPSGQGRLYDEKEKVVFEGEWNEGKLKVLDSKEYDYSTNQMTVKNRDNTVCYKGYWEDDRPEGEGICIRDGVEYKGNWNKGFLKKNKEMYIDWTDGKQVILDSSMRIRYKGEWENGKPNGQGELFNQWGNSICSGEWNDGIININDHLSYDYDTERYTDHYPNGQVRYEGGWSGGAPSGYGTMYNRFHGIKYQGTWSSGVFKVNDCTKYHYSTDSKETDKEKCDRIGWLFCAYMAPFEIFFVLLTLALCSCIVSSNKQQQDYSS